MSLYSMLFCRALPITSAMLITGQWDRRHFKKTFWKGKTSQNGEINKHVMCVRCIIYFILFSFKISQNFKSYSKQAKNQTTSKLEQNGPGIKTELQQYTKISVNRYCNDSPKFQCTAVTYIPNSLFPRFSSHYCIFNLTIHSSVLFFTMHNHLNIIFARGCCSMAR